MPELEMIPTRDMSREEWLKERRKSIGGSDAGSVLGFNEYCSPYMLWAEKTGKYIPEDISDKEAVRLGNDLEEYVAQRWEDRTGKRLRRCNYLMRNPKYPFAHADIDRRVIGEGAGFEAKTTSSFEILKQCRDGKFPDKWYCQIVHYMMVTGFERYYLGVLCFGHGFYEFTIERDDAEIEALASAERSFWELVKNDTPPAVDGSESTKEALQVILAESNGGTADLTAVSAHLEMLAMLKGQEKEIKAQINEQTAIIMDFMQDNERGTYGNYSVSFKTQSRSTFDKTAFEAVNGKIPDEYFKTSESRPFKLTVKKEK